jgi:hypothetical protein
MAIRNSTTAAGPEYKKKNSKGQSFKHATPSTGADDTDSGADALTRSTAKAMHRKGTKPGVGVADRQAPSKQRARKLVPHDQATILAEWCAGKRKSYK